MLLQARPPGAADLDLGGLLGVYLPAASRTLALRLALTELLFGYLLAVPARLYEAAAMVLDDNRSSYASRASCAVTEPCSIMGA
jgi:hypothetical protein